MENHEQLMSKPLLGKRSIIIYHRTAAPNDRKTADQEEACLRLARQNNFIIIATFNEDGISGQERAHNITRASQGRKRGNNLKRSKKPTSQENLRLFEE